IEAGAVVDATGNADVAAAAGAETTSIREEHVAVQGTGLASVRPDKRYHNTDHSFSDDTDVIDATSFFVLAKEKFSKDFDLGQLVDSRERRQIIGDMELGPADFLTDRRFPDTICVSSSNFDTHGYTIHPLFLVKPPDKERLWVQVPYRCLLPRGLDGILVTGLGVSAHRDALPVIRMQPDVQNQGYAAGRAAAMAAQAGTGVRDIDLKQLQQHLIEIGNLPETVLSDEDTFPVSDEKLHWAVNEGWETHEGIALCFAEAERALPLLREAHDTTQSDNRWLYALALGLMGDNHGAATLRDEVNGREWDDGWNYKGMGQFGMSSSEVDAMLMALGRCDDEVAWPVVLQKIADLRGVPDFSHCRAIAEACEQLFARVPEEDASSALASILRRDGVGGHSHTSIAEAREALTDNPNEDDVRNGALRELHLARALYRCGDLDGRGEQTLRRYADDIRGHFARHARAVLGGAQAS
ncbi:MAG: FAD-dependent oxidoreductase, partial [Planctomycetota bacterium]|nr:FAD-dependent oxidoreductase [Planctomycetota bacterium]